MIEFDSRYFRKIPVRGKGVQAFVRGAQRDLEIARESERPEVTFTFSYSALFKGGQALLAGHGVRVRSVPGHHMRVLDSAAEILQDISVSTVGDRMRKKRNTDLYGVGIVITEKESHDYFKFVESVLEHMVKEVSDIL